MKGILADINVIGQVVHLVELMQSDYPRGPADHTDNLW